MEEFAQGIDSHNFPNASVMFGDRSSVLAQRRRIAFLGAHGFEQFHSGFGGSFKPRIAKSNKNPIGRTKKVKSEWHNAFDLPRCSVILLLQLEIAPTVNHNQC